jgi:hypothetical protein
MDTAWSDMDLQGLAGAARMMFRTVVVDGFPIVESAIASTRQTRYQAFREFLLHVRTLHPGDLADEGGR